MTPEEFQACIQEIERLRYEMWRMDLLIEDLIFYSALAGLATLVVVGLFSEAFA